MSIYLSRQRGPKLGCEVGHLGTCEGPPITAEAEVLRVPTFCFEYSEARRLANQSFCLAL